LSFGFLARFLRRHALQNRIHLIVATQKSNPSPLISVPTYFQTNFPRFALPPPLYPHSLLAFRAISRPAAERRGIVNNTNLCEEMAALPIRRIGRRGGRALPAREYGSFLAPRSARVWAPERNSRRLKCISIHGTLKHTSHTQAHVAQIDARLERANQHRS
jgi:hypothetical protein